MELSEILITRIQNEGPVSFQEFMEVCLYYPALGYYASANNQIGKDGDFYTSPSLTPVFGELIGKQLEEMWCIMGKPAFTIVEYGAGTGFLCYDILTYLKKNESMYNQLRYCIIEKSPSMREIERKYLGEKVYWYDSIEEIQEINGCILSNELVDNFSVHQVVMQDELMEVFVDYQDSFMEKLQPAKDELKQYFSALGVQLPRGFRTEVNLQTISWIKAVANSLKRGYVMTIDYGYQSSELYKTCRNQGTLLCYHKHTVSDLIYENIGKQDLTSHVNFSAISHWGAAYGLKDCGFTDQCHFLLALGFKSYIIQAMSHEKDIVHAAKKITQLSHTLLMDMGLKFKVLIQEKDLCGEKLSGLAELNGNVIDSPRN